MVQKTRDWVYIVYLLVHLGPTFLVDAQALPISHILPFSQGLRSFCRSSKVSKDLKG